MLLLFNKQFAEACEERYSPNYAFCISRNDGLMNSNINLFKDTVINLNAFLDLGRDSYSPEQLAKIKNIQEKYLKILNI